MFPLICLILKFQCLDTHAAIISHGCCGKPHSPQDPVFCMCDLLVHCLSPHQEARACPTPNRVTLCMCAYVCVCCMCTHTHTGCQPDLQAGFFLVPNYCAQMHGFLHVSQHTALLSPGANCECRVSTERPMSAVLTPVASGPSGTGPHQYSSHSRPPDRQIFHCFYLYSNNLQRDFLLFQQMLIYLLL